MINARSETAHLLPAFRDAMKSRRCLIPADGFYEWSRRGTVKQPFCFEVHNGELFAFAGLWERWRNPAGDWIRSCSILTTTPNAITSQVHDRMPVILEKSDYELWLDPDVTDFKAIRDILKPYDATAMRLYPVNRKLNNSNNDDAESASPVILDIPTQANLF